MEIESIVWQIEYRGFNYSVKNLKRLGLKNICREYGIKYNDLTLMERDNLWQELLELASDIEFRRDFDKYGLL